jgi:hypothetical protein
MLIGTTTSRNRTSVRLEQSLRLPQCLAVRKSKTLSGMRRSRTIPPGDTTVFPPEEYSLCSPVPAGDHFQTHSSNLGPMAPLILWRLFRPKELIERATLQWASQPRCASDRPVALSTEPPASPMSLKRYGYRGRLPFGSRPSLPPRSTHFVSPVPAGSPGNLEFRIRAGRWNRAIPCLLSIWHCPLHGRMTRWPRYIAELCPPRNHVVFNCWNRAAAHQPPTWDARKKRRVHRPRGASSCPKRRAHEIHRPESRKSSRT